MIVKYTTYFYNKMTKLSQNQLLVDKIFKPNNQGISDWISRDYLESTKLKLGRNGAQRHGIFFGDKRFNWEKKKGKSRITEAIRTIGYSDNYLHGHSRPIREDIEKYHKSMGCVVCGSNSALVTDHKNDLYNDRRVLNRETQTKEDFQCLCTHCNLQKKQINRITRETGKRFGATNIPQLSIFGIDFIKGDQNFDMNDVNAMEGTYWYDPVAFMQYIRNVHNISN